MKRINVKYFKLFDRELVGNSLGKLNKYLSNEFNVVSSLLTCAWYTDLLYKTTYCNVLFVYILYYPLSNVFDYS